MKHGKRRLIESIAAAALVSAMFAAAVGASDGVPAAFGEEQTLAAQKGFESLWSPPDDPDREIVRRAYRAGAREKREAFAVLEKAADGPYDIETMKRIGEALAILWIIGGEDSMARLREFYITHDRRGEWFPGPSSLLRSDPGAAPPPEMSAPAEGLSGPYCSEDGDGVPLKEDGSVAFDALEDEVMEAIFANGLSCLDLPGELHELGKKRKWTKNGRGWAMEKFSKAPAGAVIAGIRILAVNDEKNDVFARFSAAAGGFESVYRIRMKKENTWKLTGLWNMTRF